MTEKTKRVLILILLAIAIGSLLCAVLFGILTSINPNQHKQAALILMYFAICGLSLSVPLFVVVALLKTKNPPTADEQNKNASGLECYFCGYQNPVSSTRCSNCGKKLE